MSEIEIPDSPYHGYEHVTASAFSRLSFSLYGELIKIKQLILLVYTTILAYLISTWPDIVVSDLSWLIVGAFFAISGSTLLNMYIDQDIDALMERTKHRAIPSGKIPPSTVLKHGLLFTGAGILVIGVFLNILTMVIVLLGFFIDVVVYSLWLKRRTRFSIIFGGIAGGLPAVAGRTAVTGTIDLVAVLMGLFVLSWIPLHILTLALLPQNLEDYKNAQIPMWPVVSSPTQTIRVITLSALLSAFLIVITGIILQISLLLILPLIVFCLFILFHVAINLKRPSNAMTFKIFKIASIFMVFAFIWLFVGIVFSS